jgi:predicted Zn-dependent peptidase
MRDFYQRYRPQHLIVGIAGDISPEEILLRRKAFALER